ncbi:MAG TPA: hypothetical protein VEB86_10935, partial [Chryseosolibacter sp.]|nr:hypothetical protein [Chryseosolibacter sp.]
AARGTFRAKAGRGEFMRIQGEIIFFWNGKAYRISDCDKEKSAYVAKITGEFEFIPRCDAQPVFRISQHLESEIMGGIEVFHN